jgi:hypothetical protein
MMRKQRPTYTSAELELQLQQVRSVPPFRLITDELL